MKYSVNIEVIYKKFPFAERFAAAKRDGWRSATGNPRA